MDMDTIQYTAPKFIKAKETKVEEIKNYSRNQLEIIFKKIVGYKNNVDYFNSSNNKGANHTINLDKYATDDLIKQIQKFQENYKPMSINKQIPKSLFIPEIPEEEKIIPSTQKSRKGRKTIKIISIHF